MAHFQRWWHQGQYCNIVPGATNVGNEPTFRRHSHYTRVLADLPCAGFRVQLVLHVRKFFCDTVDCARKIFTERFPAFVEPWARVTVRLRQALEVVGIATCGEVGTRLGKRLALPTSPTTLLRRVMALPTDKVGSVKQLGVDAFALRRGRSYGTVLVDLVRHQVIELLPDRKAETAKVWMQSHPEIDLVTLDRGGDYASAASQGAPQAVQSANRFHLVKNLTEAVQKALVHCRTELQKELKRAKPADPPAEDESAGGLRDPRAIPALQALLTHQKARLRLLALRALVQVDHQQALPSLFTALCPPNEPYGNPWEEVTNLGGSFGAGKESGYPDTSALDFL